MSEMDEKLAERLGRICQGMLREDVVAQADRVDEAEQLVAEMRLADTAYGAGTRLHSLRRVVAAMNEYCYAPETESRALTIAVRAVGAEEQIVKSPDAGLTAAGVLTARVGIALDWHALREAQISAEHVSAGQVQAHLEAAGRSSGEVTEMALLKAERSSAKARLHSRRAAEFGISATLASRSALHSLEHSADQIDAPARLAASMAILGTLVNGRPDALRRQIGSVAADAFLAPVELAPGAAVRHAIDVLAAYEGPHTARLVDRGLAGLTDAALDMSNPARAAASETLLRHAPPGSQQHGALLVAWERAMVQEALSDPSRKRDVLKSLHAKAIAPEPSALQAVANDAYFRISYPRVTRMLDAVGAVVPGCHRSPIADLVQQEQRGGDKPGARPRA